MTRCGIAALCSFENIKLAECLTWELDIPCWILEIEKPVSLEETGPIYQYAGNYALLKFGYSSSIKS